MSTNRRPILIIRMFKISQKLASTRDTRHTVRISYYFELMGKGAYCNKLQKRTMDFDKILLCDDAKIPEQVSGVQCNVLVHPFFTMHAV